MKQLSVGQCGNFASITWTRCLMYMEKSSVRHADFQIAWIPIEMTRFRPQKFTKNTKWIIWNLQLEILVEIRKKKKKNVLFVCKWYYTNVRNFEGKNIHCQYCSDVWSTAQKEVTFKLSNFLSTWQIWVNNLNAMRILSGEIFCPSPGSFLPVSAANSLHRLEPDAKTWYTFRQLPI